MSERACCIHNEADTTAKRTPADVSSPSGPDSTEAEQPPEQLPLPISMPSQKADLCPDCGQASFVAMEGCRKCVNCGFSEC